MNREDRDYFFQQMNSLSQDSQNAILCRLFGSVENNEDRMILLAHDIQIYKDLDMERGR